MPVLSQRRDEIGEPLEELKRREFDDTVGPRPRGRPPATRADPVGRLVSGEHVADASDPAIFTAAHEPQWLSIHPFRQFRGVGVGRRFFHIIQPDIATPRPAKTIVEGSGTTTRLPLAAWNTRYVPSVAPPG